jgi:hypothetical protein
LSLQRLQEIDDRLIRSVRHSMGRNVATVEAEIKELERELALPGKPVQDVDDFEEVGLFGCLSRHHGLITIDCCLNAGKQLCHASLDQ